MTPNEELSMASRGRYLYARAFQAFSEWPAEDSTLGHRPGH